MCSRSLYGSLWQCISKGVCTVRAFIWCVQCCVFIHFTTGCVAVIDPISEHFLGEFRMNVKLSRCHLHADQAAFYCNGLHLLFKLRYCDSLCEQEIYWWKLGLSLNDQSQLELQWMIAQECLVKRDITDCKITYVASACDIAYGLMIMDIML